MATDKLNKVLNRPLFRQQALKKGDLKPIKAQIGQMVGMPTGGPTVVNPSRLPIPVGPVVDRTPKPPGMFQRGIGTIQRGLQAIGDYTMNPMSKSFFARPGPLGKTILAPYGLYTLGRDITGSETVGGLASLAGFTPIGRGIGQMKNIYDLGKYALDPKLDPKTNVLSTRFGDISNFMPQSYYGLQEAKKVEAEKRAQASKKRNIANLLTPPTTGDASGLSYAMASDTPEFTYMSKEQQDKVISRNATRLAREAGISETKAKNIVRAAFFNEVNQAEASRAVGDDAAYAMTISNTYNDPKLNIPGPKTKEQAEVSEGAAKKPEPKKVDQPTKLGDGKIDMRTPAQPESPSTTNKGISSDLVKRAKEIYAELGQGRSSNANLVFLANLATGLLSGKTSQSGVGGALEVLGAALGPATTNYAIMKLKEDEISNKLMTEALDAAAAEASAMAKARGTMTDATSGVIQFIDKNGNISNKIGRRLKNGVTQVQISGNQFATVQPGSTLEGFKVGDFIKEGLNDAGRLKLMDASRQRIKAYRTLDQALKSLADNKEAAGITGIIDLNVNRIKGAFEDLVGNNQIDVVYSNDINKMKDNLKSERLKMKKRIDDAKRRYSEGDRELSKSQIKKMEEIYNSSKSYQDKIIQKYRTKGVTESAILEKLAVDEVTLTYALANSFKDTDRLTQRDIDAASKIVNIFTWTRGSDQVRDSLRAIGSDLKRDIESFRKSMQALGATDTQINIIFGDYDSMTFSGDFEKTVKSFRGIKTDQLKQNKSLKDLQLGK